MPNQPDTDSVTTEAWQSLQLNIRVCFASSLSFYPHKLTTKPFMQPDSVQTIQDALARVSLPRFAQVVPSSSSSSSNEATQEVLFEALPEILVLHLERFTYVAATKSIEKITKPVRFGRELEIPLGTDFLVCSPASEG